MPKSISVTTNPPYPSKLFYHIQEVAKITDLKPYVLRYWESEFSMLSPEKEKNDQRRYRKTDIEMILKIKELLYEQKFTIAGARQSIKTSSPKQRAVRKESLKGIRAELTDLLDQLSA